MEPRTCSIDGCDKPVQARGWCWVHWKRWQRHGDPVTKLSAGVDYNVRGGCKVDGCDRLHSALGFCDLHYVRFKSNGDPLVVRNQKRFHCTVEGCPRPHYAKDLCKHHYTQSRKGKNPRTCIVPGCGGEHVAKGFCRKHYNQKDPFAPPKVVVPRVRVSKPCSVEGCERGVYSKSLGLCEMHYTRWRRNRDLNVVKSGGRQAA